MRAPECSSNCRCTGTHALALTVLGLSATGLALSEVPELVEQLRKFPALKQLDVSANPALSTPDGAFEVAALLEHFPLLRRIRLSRSGITRAHLPELLPMLQRLTVLVEVDLSHNALDVEDVCQCFQSLASIRSLAIVSFVRRMQSLAPQLRVCLRAQLTIDAAMCRTATPAALAPTL